MPYRIVVADPSPSVQKAAQLVFAEPEFRVHAFEDGASLLGAVDGLRPDALVVSLTLPGRDGYELGRALRSRKGLEAVPLVGLRGAFEGLDADKSAPPEYDEVVAKPFDSERLAAVVRELIARKTGPATLPEEPVPPPAAAGGAGRGRPQGLGPGRARRHGEGDRKTGPGARRGGPQGRNVGRQAGARSKRVT